MSVIAVIEPKWWGHHPMFAKRITRALLEQGHHVLLVCAAPQDVSAYLEEAKLEGRSTRIWFEELGYSELVTYPSFSSRMRALYRNIRIWFEKDRKSVV